jgi:hypothetical protein
MAVGEYYSNGDARRPATTPEPDVRMVTTRDKDAVLVANRWLVVIPNVGYDHMCRVAPAKPLRRQKTLCLFVSDYGCGQKWTSARAIGIGQLSRSFFDLPRHPDGNLTTSAPNHPGTPDRVL